METVSSVLGITGSKVALPCNITPPVNDDAVALILWYKDDITKPIYSVDARKTNIEQARHVTGEAVSTRVSLSLDDNPSILYLEYLTEEDEGEYRCRVDFRRARSRNGIVYLQLVVPPKKPIITDQNGEILESLIGPYNEEDDLHLICEAEEGKPLPSVTWWRESVLLDDTYTVTPHGVVRNELEIQSLKRHDLMAVFTCQASNNNFSQPAIAAVTVDMNFRPVSVKLDGGPRSMSADKPEDLLCKSAGSKPPAVISWWMGTTRLKHNKDTVSTDGNFTTSVLRFRPSIEDNGKTLACRAENPLIAGSALDDTWELEIHYVPQLVLRLGSKLRHFRIQEGNDVYMECDIRANPWVTEIGWAFEGRELHTNVSAGLIISNQSLVLQKVQRTNRGHYTCSASNSEGMGESKPLYLSIQYSPVCVPGQKILYGATKHEEVKVICEVDADPTDITFTWSFNKSGENIEDVPFVNEGTRSIATVTAKTDYDYGTLTCSSSNGVGIQREPCVFTVITAGPPEPVQNCTIMNVTQHSFRLECMEGSNGGLRQFFVMEVHDTALHSLRGNQTADLPFFLARDLPPATSFVVVVYAVNAKGRSQAVVLRANTLSIKQVEQQKGSRWQLTSQVMIVILSAFILVILLLGIALIIIRKTRRRMQDQKRNAKRNSKTSDTMFKNSKEGKGDMCMCPSDEDEKPHVMTPEVITMANYVDNQLYYPRDKPPSPSYIGDQEKDEPLRRRDNVFVRLQHSLTRRKKGSDLTKISEESQIHAFHSNPLEKKNFVQLPDAISQHISTETMIADDPHNRWYSDVQSGLEPERIHIITGITTPC
nr:neural cell adhesion molecule 2-like [Parasteatoda tepidariorum]